MGTADLRVDSMTKSAGVLVGVGRYGDHWHDYVATGCEVARILEDAGFNVRMSSLRAAGVAEMAPCDLLVVNAGFGEYNESVDGPTTEWDEAYTQLSTFRQGGKPLLALHAAALSLKDFGEWHDWMGGSWVAGSSMHPPIAASTVEVVDRSHPITAGLEEFEVYDEKYSYLDIAPDARTLASHQFEGGTHPILWVLEVAPGRVVYDALGHDRRSYRSATRRELLRRSAEWLIS
jgi:uncharacterized protein